MKLVSFDDGRVGLLDGNEIVDVTELIPGGPDRDWPPSAPLRAIASFDLLVERYREKKDVLARAMLDSVSLLAPVPRPSQLIALPTNYDDHIAEMASPNRADRNGFFMLGPSSISGPQDPIVLPDLDGYQIHHECELAVVIGTPAFRVSEAEALEHVFGYSCLVDVTVRGKQERAMRKSYPSFTPLGPYVVTRDEIGDPDNLQLRLSVNGEIRHDGNTHDMIVGVRAAIAMVSSVLRLEPGDVIATGTPAGVGPLLAGDLLHIEVEHVGEMTLDVIQGEGGANLAISRTSSASAT